MSTDHVFTGVGPEAPTITNERGGKQSDVPFAFDCFDPPAMFAMARVLAEGTRKYGKNNWRNIPEADHINHLLMHIFAYAGGDTSDEHISHIMCRAMFLAGVHYQPNAKQPVYSNEDHQRPPREE